jgi:curved DNA-binding protein CbpA
MTKQSRRHSPEGATISKYPDQQQHHPHHHRGENKKKGINGRRHPSSPNTSSNNNSMTISPPSSPPHVTNNSAALDLKVIDDAFGMTCDLYTDVLQVSTDATQEEIQLAYFDRRSELFTLLAKIDSKPQSESMVSQRYKAERKMDSVVLAVRILGDPGLRSTYDDQIRPHRVASPKKKSQQQHQQHIMATPERVSKTSGGSGVAVQTPTSTARRSRSSSRSAAKRNDVPPSVVTPPGGGSGDGASLFTGMMNTHDASPTDMELTAIEMQPQPSSPKSSPSSPSSPKSSSPRGGNRKSSGHKARERSPKKKRQDSSTSATTGGWFSFGTSNKSMTTDHDHDHTGQNEDGDSKAATKAGAATTATTATTNSRSRNGQISSLDTFENDESGLGSTTMESRQEDETQTQAETVETLSTVDNKDLGAGLEDGTDVLAADIDDDGISKAGGGGGGFFSCFSANRTLKTISDEISGACEDTLVSVDQVFNAFTLTDKDIKAVTKKIDKAKRQLDT